MSEHKYQENDERDIIIDILLKNFYPQPILDGLPECRKACLPVADEIIAVRRPSAAISEAQDKELPFIRNDVDYLVYRLWNCRNHKDFIQAPAWLWDISRRVISIGFSSRPSASPDKGLVPLDKEQVKGLLDEHAYQNTQYSRETFTDMVAQRICSKFGATSNKASPEIKTDWEIVSLLNNCVPFLNVLLAKVNESDSPLVAKKTKQMIKDIDKAAEQWRNKNEN